MSLLQLDGFTFVGGEFKKTKIPCDNCCEEVVTDWEWVNSGPTGRTYKIIATVPYLAGRLIKFRWVVWRRQEVTTSPPTVVTVTESVTSLDETVSLDDGDITTDDDGNMFSYVESEVYDLPDDTNSGGTAVIHSVVGPAIPVVPINMGISVRTSGKSKVGYAPFVEPDSNPVTIYGQQTASGSNYSGTIRLYPTPVISNMGSNVFARAAGYSEGVAEFLNIVAGNPKPTIVSPTVARWDKSPDDYLIITLSSPYPTSVLMSAVQAVIDAIADGSEVTAGATLEFTGKGYTTIAERYLHVSEVHFRLTKGKVTFGPDIRRTFAQDYPASFDIPYKEVHVDLDTGEITSEDKVKNYTQGTTNSSIHYSPPAVGTNRRIDLALTDPVVLANHYNFGPTYQIVAA